MDAIDTTGAGDIFHGAFTYGIAKKIPLEETLKFANIVAGLSSMRKDKFIVAILISKVFLVLFWGFVGTTFIDSFQNPIDRKSVV